MLSVFTISILFFVVTGLQYWGIKYLVFVINTDLDQAILSFSITVITSPILGALCGGLLISRLEGGY